MGKVEEERAEIKEVLCDFNSFVNELPWQYRPEGRKLFSRISNQMRALHTELSIERGDISLQEGEPRYIEAMKVDDSVGDMVLSLE